jgi:hypothetical protein
MKKLWFLSGLVIPIIVLALFTGCPSGGGGDVSVGTGSGSFTYKGITYPLTNASIDDWQDGDFDLYIASAGIDAYEWTGIGDIIYFELTSPTGAIAEGTYDWDDIFGYWIFWTTLGVNFNTATLTGDIVDEAVAGSVTISISGSTYTIVFALTMGDGTATGSYTGTVSIWYP